MRIVWIQPRTATQEQNRLESVLDLEEQRQTDQLLTLVDLLAHHDDSDGEVEAWKLDGQDEVVEFEVVEGLLAIVVILVHKTDGQILGFAFLAVLYDEI